VFEICLRLERHQYLATEILLDEHGACAISIEDAEDEPVFVEAVGSSPMWAQITLSALFDKEIDVAALQNNIQQALAAPIEISTKTVHEQDWQKKWMHHLQAMQFSERLWVCPSWINYPDPFAINIELDPGLAFGTGTHPTTELCLQWLANYPLMDKSVMDFGCGSGILAIAAYYLGAQAIVAIDHDPQAIQATRINAEKNNIKLQNLQLLLADKPPLQNCDVIIANVLLAPLLQFSNEFADAMTATSKIILSGILETQLAELEKVYANHFCIDEIYSKNEWLLVEASLKA